MRFNEKVAVITAAASGIGYASAILIVEQGSTVIAIDTDDRRLENMSSECSNLKGKLSTYCIDATDEEAVTKTISEVLKTHKTINILINAVGGSTIISNPKARVDELSLDDWKEILNFNLNSMFIFTNAVVPLMKRQGGGKIVNLASIAGRGFSDVSSSAYAAAKGGALHLQRRQRESLDHLVLPLMQ